MAIITLGQLAPWVGKTPTELEADPLAQPVVDQASLLVNEAVWGVGKDTAFWLLPDKPAPETAWAIATMVAARVFSNPRVVQQRSTGPMSERLADIVLTSMSLRPDEIERLHRLRPNADESEAIWIMPTVDYTLEPDDTVAYVEAYQPHPSSLMLFPSDYDHV